MMVGMAVNVCFTPYGYPIVDERLLLIPYFFIALSVTGISLIMVRRSQKMGMYIPVLYYIFIF